VRLCVYKDSDWEEPFYGSDHKNREKHKTLLARVFIFPPSSP
jgi:hypothetical protein